MSRLRILALFLLGPVLLATCRQSPAQSTGPPVANDSSSPTYAPSPVATSLPSTPEPGETVSQSPGRGLSTATATPGAVESSPDAGSVTADPLPVASPTEAIPPPAEPLPLPPDVEVLVLLGTDVEAQGAGRTDTIILVFYNRQNGAASLVSVPRDLYVYIPGWKMDRVNTAFFQGGFDSLALTLEYNLGVRPQHWVLARFSDFVRFIDDLGGISVPVSDPMPEDCGGIPPRTVHMDGTTALCYLRERRTTSDIDRSRRQQEVLQVILDRVIALESLRYLPEWYGRYRESVMTDLTLEDLFAFIPLVLKLPDSGLRKYQIAWDEVEAWKVPESGAQVFLPNRERIAALFHRAIGGLDASIPDSPALETRVAALTATATPPEPPAEPDSSEPQEPAETPIPTLPPDLTVIPSDRSTPTLAPSDTSP
jgi:polyisoprenyl-teichoic acid--peptidoglycan teichoic acid transferase